MVGWSGVTRWNPAALQNAVDDINAADNKLVACSEDLRGINTPDTPAFSSISFDDWIWPGSGLVCTWP